MVLAPEMVCLESLQEWVQARKLKRLTANTTHGELQLIHGYYLGMMGVRYRTNTGWNVLWPSQYAWLLQQKLVSWADRGAWGLDSKTICDKNKADGLIKVATMWQVIWFTVQCITRGINDIPIAPLEAMTLAYVCVALATYAFWWKKPKDIATASFVDIPQMTKAQLATFDSLAMENTYDEREYEGPPSRNVAWYLIARDYQTDLIFNEKASDQATSADLESQNFGSSGNEILPAKQSKASKDTKIITEWDATLYMSKWWPLICLLSVIFGALHLISWNSTFPTRFEQWLWRGSALVSIATSIICMQYRKISLNWEGMSTIIRIGTPILYVISRIVMTGQVFAALRAMPLKIYDTSVVWDYWFHFS